MDDPQRHQCEAKIREPLTPSLRVRGYTTATAPVSDIQCSRLSDGPVCGVYLCGQHRRKVTRWDDGHEVLSPRYLEWFAEWGVAPSAEFIPEL